MKRLALIVLCIVTLQVSAQDSGWTVPTLKEYVDQRFTSMQEAVNVAAVATEKRFDNTNEWRKSYEDLIKEMQLLIQTMQRDYVPRTEYVTIEKQVAEQKERIDKYENLKSGGIVTVAYLTAGMSFLVAIIALSRNFISDIFKKKI